MLSSTPVSAECSPTGDAGIVVVRVRGKCMDPVLEDGGTVRVRRASWYLPGDVIAYYCPHLERCLIHRFLGYVPVRGAWKCLTMADHGLAPDVLVKTADVLGKVVDDGAHDFQRGLAHRVGSLWKCACWTARIAWRTRFRGPTS